MDSIGLRWRVATVKRVCKYIRYQKLRELDPRYEPLAQMAGSYWTIFFIFLFFYKKFMPINAKGTTVAQANSECTLITTDYNKEVLKCDLNVESVGWFVILLDNEFHEDTVLGT